MARADLLALDTENLVVLSNRGIVKRAHAELEGGQLTWEIEEQDGTVTVRWSDEVRCVLPAGKALGDAQCSCPATTLCRHLVRSILAYQQAASAPPAQPPPPSEEAQSPTVYPPNGGPDAQRPAIPAEPWDPGSISDEELARHFRAADLTRARRVFEDGQLLELVRSAKPAVRFHTLTVNLRFLVPGDLRYTHCDCAEARPCSHVPLAVWGFRLLPPEKAGGLVSTRREKLPVPEALLADVERALQELAAAGVSGASKALVDRLRRLEDGCRTDGLVWPAEILAELVHQHAAYAAHDARFLPRRVAELVGELCIRMDAIRADTGAVPPQFVRGSASDRVTEVGKAQLVGLGCGAALRRGGVELSVYMQDDRSGMVVAVSREVADPPPDAMEEPKDLSRLAEWPAVKGVRLADLGAGKLQIQGGKRTPSCRFIPGRAPATYVPQAFEWEKLRPPVLVDDFAELTARLGAQPPASLRPRRVASSLYACAVAGAEGVVFSELDQAVYATLRDAQGNGALLVHLYTGRSAEGTEELLARLQSQPEALRFVAGHVRATPAGPMIAPVSAVFQEGERRVMVQPWIDRRKTAPVGGAREHPSTEAGMGEDLIAGFPGQLLELLGEQWLLGLDRTDARMVRSWSDLHAHGGALGFSRLLHPLRELLDALETKTRSVEWDSAAATRALLDVSLLAVLANEEGIAA